MTRTNKKQSYDELSVKQWVQLMRLCKEFQPIQPFEEIVFLEIIRAAREFCSYGMYPFYTEAKERFETILMKNINGLKIKYYFCGIKTNTHNLSNKQFNVLNIYIPRVKIPTFDALEGYRPIEKVLFLKIVRACRDFMRAKMSKDAEQSLFEKLSIIYNAMIY